MAYVTLEILSFAQSGVNIDTNTLRVIKKSALINMAMR